MKFVKTYSFVLFAALFVLASCKKEDVNTTDEDNATTENVVVNGVGEGDGDGEGEGDPGADNTVIVYSAEWCGACTSLKSQLDGAGIEYEVRDVDEDEYSSECYSLILEAGYEIDGSYSIPVARVNDNPVLYGADCTLENIEDQL